MIALVDTSPETDVEPAEYSRLLGYPPGHVLEGRAAELAEWAREWYAAHGRPWVVLRGSARLTSGAGLRPESRFASGAALQPVWRFASGAGLQPDPQVASGAGLQPCVSIDGILFTPTRLHDLLVQAEAHAVVLAAMSAGEELETEAQRLWQEEKPDEYFFLEMYGSAVVEHLAMRTGARLCAWAEAQEMAVLPHDSPGYAGWNISEQARLLPVVLGEMQPPGPLRVMESGALVPKKSLLAVYGVTRQADSEGRLTSMVPCEHCTLPRCQYRRRPYMWSKASASLDARDAAAEATDDTTPSRASALAAGRGSATPLRSNPAYRTSRKALQRWARERLSMVPREDGGVDAQFRYDGTTCTNMGRELAFRYDVTLGPRSEGFPIRAQRCAPAPGDAGHTSMCAYIRNASELMAAIEAERPLVGLRLDDVLSWARASSAAGCYCDAASREHKWGLVLETIHFALSQKESADALGKDARRL